MLWSSTCYYSPGVFMDNFVDHFKTILDRMPIGCMLHDQRLHFTYWNPAAEKIFQYSFQEVKGRRPLDVFSSSSGLPGNDEFYRLLLNIHLEQDCVCENRTKEGRVTACEWRYTPLHDADGALAGALLTCRDLTDRKRLEEQLQQAQKMETMGLLVSGIAHDFNNLLTVIGGYTRMLMRDMDPVQHSYHQAEQVAEAADRAAALTGQLLAFTRRRVPQSEILDLNAVVAKMEKLMRRILGEDVELSTPLGANLGGVRADQGQIEQIIMNLVVNSRWAMPNGGRLTIETAGVVLDREHSHGSLSCPPGRYVVLAVSDTGHGMDAATRNRIFEPFFTTKDEGEGCGIGLATVKGILKQIESHILVYSEPGFGTTFKIYFPVTDAAVTPVAAPLTAPEETAAVGTVLLVEDETRVLETVRLMLTRQGYSVLEASSAEAARRICREFPHKIDLLLTDVVLRNGNGPDLARDLCPSRPDMPVIYMSGYPDPFTVRGRSGVQFLQKPFTARTLQAAVQKALTHSNSLARLNSATSVDTIAQTCDTQSNYESVPTGSRPAAGLVGGCPGI